MNWFRYIGSYLWGYTLQRYRSEVNGILEVCYRNGRTVLDSAEANYSYGRLHDVFRRALRTAGIHRSRPGKVLILGFGAGSIAGILQHEVGISCRITGVEHDPVVINILNEWFSPEKLKDLELHLADAVEYAGTCTDTFGLITVDLFRDQDVPAAAIALPFISRLRSLLEPGACLLFNYIVTDRKQEALYKELVQNLQVSGMEPREYRYYGINRVLCWVKPFDTLLS